MDTEGRLALKSRLKELGFDIDDVEKWPARTTFYKPDGTKMPNLPCDVYSVQKYLDKGFTLKPPKRIVKFSVKENEVAKPKRKRRTHRLKKRIKKFKKILAEKLRLISERLKILLEKVRRIKWMQKHVI